MPIFMIERRYAEDVEASVEAVDGITRINDEEGVRWLYSFLSADMRKTHACTRHRPRSPSVALLSARDFRRTSWWRSPSGSEPTGHDRRSERRQASRCSAA